jgi:hypothetical protein
MKSISVAWLSAANDDLDKLYVDARHPADLGLLPDGKPTIEEAIAFNKLAIYIHNKIKSVL